MRLKLLALFSAQLVACGALAEDAARQGLDPADLDADAGAVSEPTTENSGSGLTPPPDIAPGPMSSGAPLPVTPGTPAPAVQPSGIITVPNGTPGAPSPTGPTDVPSPTPDDNAGPSNGAGGGSAGGSPGDESSNGGSDAVPVVGNGGAAGSGVGGSSAGGSSPGSGGAGGSTETPLLQAFNIELVFDDVDTIDASVLDAFRVAEERWEAVIVGDLPDVAASIAGDCNGHPVPDGVDDLVIFVSVVPFDGPQGLLGAAGPCAIRSAGTRLPFAGAMEFDEDDLQSFAAMGRLDEIVLHEMGHVLGIGSMWEALSLLDNPSDGSGMADTAFNGSQARVAFDSVGGDSYEGNKVPVENSGSEGEVNGHWRESALGSELMTTKMGSSPAQLSVVTIASLQDLGYVVSFDVADDYSWPSVDEALAFKTIGEPAESVVIDLSHDHLLLPLYEVSEDGVTRWLTPP